MAELYLLCAWDVLHTAMRIFLIYVGDSLLGIIPLVPRYLGEHYLYWLYNDINNAIAYSEGWQINSVRL